MLDEQPVMPALAGVSMVAPGNRGVLSGPESEMPLRILRARQHRYNSRVVWQLLQTLWGGGLRFMGRITLPLASALRAPGLLVVCAAWRDIILPLVRCLQIGPVHFDSALAGKGLARSMAHYFFVTRWKIDAPLERVWDVIADAPAWPQWWRAVAGARVLKEGAPPSFIGRELRLTWRTQLPYGFTFDMTVTRVEPPNILEGVARGELAGTGTWRFSHDGDGTILQYDWDVTTNVPWMNAFAPLLKPAFVYNHNVVMRWGQEGLAKRLGARVTELSEGESN